MNTESQNNSTAIEQTPASPVVQWTQLLLAIAAILNAASQLINSLHHC